MLLGVNASLKKNLLPSSINFFDSNLDLLINFVLNYFKYFNLESNI